MPYRNYRIFSNHIRRVVSLTRIKMSSSVNVQLLNENIDVNSSSLNPVKSISDDKEYKVIKLPNGLVACLIADKNPVEFTDSISSDEESESDHGETDEEEYSGEEDDSCPPDTKKVRLAPEDQKMAAAALCVGIGSFSDPKEIPGLAHFLEHMVFMGSSKYPKENYFDAYVQKRGGDGNASTNSETTLFQFECLPKYLNKTLDIFANFFISPLMLKSAMTREREAIESEFQMALTDDDSRREQFLCSLAPAESVVNNFAWGNLLSLRDNVDDDTLYSSAHEFRKKHYSAHRMTLAVQARFTMDVLETMVRTCFSAVPCNKVPRDEFDEFKNNLYNTPGFNKIYYLEPQQDITKLDLTWCLPSLLKKYKSKPHKYVAWLISDEGKGSLLSHLKKKVWALESFCSSGEIGIENNSLYTLFTVSLNLTAEGLTNVKDVISMVFSYINMLRQLGPQERIFKELQIIARNSFNFTLEEQPMDYVERVSEAMQVYDSEDYLTGSDLYFEYNPQDIKSVLDELVPEKMNVIIRSKTHNKLIYYDQKEPWFNTSYTMEEIPPELIESWQKVKPESEMHVPLPNEYITTQFAILPESDIHPDYPNKILESPLVEMWYRKDQKFQLPFARYYFYLITPLSIESPLSSCKLDILSSMFHIQSAEVLYPAQLAELSWSVRNDEKGITFKISGFNEKLPMLADRISEQLKKLEFEMTPEIFEAVRTELKKGYFNSFLKPENLTKDLRFSLLIDHHFTSLQKFKVISEITFDSMKKFCIDFLSTLYMKVLIQGNVTQDVAISVTKKFVKTLDYKALQKELYPKFKVWSIPVGQKYCRVQSFNENDANSVVTNYYQYGPYNEKANAILEIILTIINEPAFDILRTKEQLGYCVSCCLRETFGLLGYTITVNCQANKFTTKHVDERIENFIKTMNKTFEKMSVKKFNSVKEDLIKVKNVGDIELEEEANRNWTEIISDKYTFDRVKREISAIRSVDVADARKFWRKINVSPSPKRKSENKKLSIQVVGFEIMSKSRTTSLTPEDFLRSFKDIDITYLPSPITEEFIGDISDFKKKTVYELFDKTT